MIFFQINLFYFIYYDILSNSRINSYKVFVKIFEIIASGDIADKKKASFLYL